MEKDIITKINKVFVKKGDITEDEVRSVMILLRKLLEIMPDAESNSFLLLRLFCNWVAHIEITDSNTGLRILARVNDALVFIRHSGDPVEMGLKMSEAISFKELRRELKSLLNKIGVDDEVIRDNEMWGTVFLTNLIEILRDVPLAFPKTLNATRLRIYNGIAQNPIKPGAHVIAACLSKVGYPEPGTKNPKSHLCIVIRTADTTTIIIPLVVDIRLQ